MLVSSITKDSSININRKVLHELNLLQKEGLIRESNSLGIFLISEKEQKEKLEEWNRFWMSRKESTIENLREGSIATGFSQNAFASFIKLISEPQQVSELLSFIKESKTLSQLLIERNGKTSLISSIVCNKTDEKQIRERLKGISGLSLVDGESIVGVLIEAVKADFNYLLLFASGAVFVAMLLIYGSLELTIVSFVPMVISWIWILGIASIFDIRFNFINIILATFIFGLGDDFSIFITDGLQKKYKYKEKVLGHYKTGILLSSISTIVGTGVLIFAEHPALKSIALLSVLGIVTIVFVSFFVQPVLFRFFITSRVEKGKPPMTLFGIAISIMAFLAFVLGNFLIVFLCFIMRGIPFLNPKTKKYIIHVILQKVCGLEMDILFMSRKDILDLKT